MRKTEKTIAGQTKVVLEVSVFDDDDIEEIKLHFRKEPNISVSLSELEVLNLFENNIPNVYHMRLSIVLYD